MNFVMMRKRYPTITMRAAALYDQLAGLAVTSERNGYRDALGVYVWPSRETLAEWLGCCSKTARKAVQELKALGLVIERRAGQGRNNRLYVQPLAQQPPKPSSTGSETRSICMMRKAAAEPAAEQMTLEAVEPSQNMMHPDAITPSSAEITQERPAKPCKIEPVSAPDRKELHPIEPITSIENVIPIEAIYLSTLPNRVLDSTEDSRAVDRHVEEGYEATKNGQQERGNAEESTTKHQKPCRKAAKRVENPAPPRREEYRLRIPAAATLDHDTELAPEEADELTGLLDIAIDAAITTRPTHKIFGSEIPALDVRRALQRLDLPTLRSVQSAINDQIMSGNHIRNVRAYALTALYAAVQCRGLLY